MKRYTVCREYLLPVYSIVVVEAESVEEACTKALDDLTLPWDEQQCDYESCGATYIAAIAEVPEDVEDPYDLNPYDMPTEQIPDDFNRRTAIEKDFL